MRSFGIFLVCLVMLTVTDCQTLVYYCNFDAGLVEDCVFDKSTGVFALATTSGVIPTYLEPTEPLSDVTSIRSLTTPNNETCIFPYNYSTGNWSMYFCQWNSPTNFTCPTASGIGNCIIGNYASVRTNAEDFDEMYLTKISTKSNTIHCLDFFYYLTDPFNEVKISFGWKSNETTITIVEVGAVSENRWQQSQTTYISPSSEINQIWFRMMRSSASLTMLTYALDEIKIFEGSCESTSLAVIPFSDAVESDVITNETSEIPTRFTTDVITDETSEIPTRFTTDVTSTVTTTVLDTTMSTDPMKLTTNDDVQTTTIFRTTDEEMNMTTSDTSDVNLTTTTIIITSQTGSTTIETTTTSDSSTVSFTEKTDLIVTLGVPLGLGIPALLIIIGGLFYHYRKGQLQTKALSSHTDANEIAMTVRNA